MQNEEVYIQPELVYSEELINEFFRGFRSPIDHTPIDLIGETLRIAIKNGITLNLSQDEQVLYPGTEAVYCAGYFTGEVFAVAFGKPEEEWLKVFTHESCHMDQFLEDPIKWKEYDIIDNIDPWLEHKKEFTPEELQIIIDKVIELEEDCERRTVTKIRDWELNINIEDYIKQANAYLFFYRFVQLTRAWYGGVDAFYRDPQILELCPDYFLDSYATVPEAVMNKMLDIHQLRQNGK